MGATEKKIGIQIDDGTRRIPITNMHDEEIGVFYFRPTDVGIIERYEKVKGEFEDVLKPLENISIAPDGTPRDPEDVEAAAALTGAKTKLFALLDMLFDGNFATAFFGKMNPFSPVGGRFYCETAIDAVGAYIEAEFGEESRKMSKRAKKYTEGY